MAHNFFEDEDQEVLNDILIAMSGAIERVFEYIAANQEPGFNNPETAGYVCVQVLAQLLANHIDQYPEDQRETVREFVKEQQDLVYTLRAEHYRPVEKPQEDDPEDPHGLKKMTPMGRA